MIFILRKIKIISANAVIFCKNCNSYVEMKLFKKRKIQLLTSAHAVMLHKRRHTAAEVVFRQVVEVPPHDLLALIQRGRRFRILNTPQK